ncbi:MAG: hypothetical protein JNK30_17110 [Phenylobacterium sp.]|uniref:hypothetical protein n=1 Tax=Phenylobacterium sp. TaxID=1871053 RepID=UPI001A51F169|nr:hypothetical protein [Phenylobacterium sp.]MBL8773105.1 hypothetical protein [Phenylobacterium sp.]
MSLLVRVLAAGTAAALLANAGQADAGQLYNATYAGVPLSPPNTGVQVLTSGLDTTSAGFSTPTQALGLAYAGGGRWPDSWPCAPDRPSPRFASASHPSQTT